MASWTVLLAALLAPCQLDAQWLDARMPGAGELRIGIDGESLTADSRILPDGTEQTLADAFSVPLDVRLVPPLDTLNTVLTQFLTDLGREPIEATTLGTLRYDVIFEWTRAPISLNLGVTDWLSAFAVVPIVKGRSFVGPTLDSLTAAAGPVSSAFGGDAETLFNDLASAISMLESIVLADTLAAGRQAQAESLLAQARTFETGLGTLRDLTYVPTDSSAAGREIAGTYSELEDGFEAFDLSLPELALARAIGPEAAAEIAATADFGAESPGSRSTGIRFGDIELGVSLQPLNSFRHPPGQARPTFPIRARFDALWRLPTGAPRVADRLTDAGTGDGQADLEFRGTLDLGFGRRLWLSLFAAYNLQLETTIERLITPPATPLSFGAYTANVRWNPGDELTVAVVPRLNLTRNVTVSTIYSVTRRDRDGVEAVDAVPTGAVFVPSDLEEGTEYTARTLTFALRYSSGDWASEGGDGTPVDVEVRYRRTASASDGLVPKLSVWQVAVRVFRPIF